MAATRRRRVSPAKRRKNSRISSLIQKGVRKWKKTGKLGRSRPRSKRKAIKQAAAISYSIERRRAKKRASARRRRKR